ncbi:hypothetical protein [Pacificispira sp.]|uniref:hypothetical protein n=1 Tax=Pacificispira sp. TaxID=2888761 RepID=UPI003BACEDF2
MRSQKNRSFFSTIPALIIFLSLVLASCGGPRVENIDSKVLTEISNFKYKVAYLSEIQPEPGGIFFSRNFRTKMMMEALVSRGYVVSPLFASIGKKKSKTKYSDILIECYYTAPKQYMTNKGGFGVSVSCDAFDLFDGEKVFEAHADVLYGGFNSHDVPTFEAIRMALVQLPKATENVGKVMSETEASSRLDNR